MLGSPAVREGQDWGEISLGRVTIFTRMTCMRPPPPPCFAWSPSPASRWRSTDCGFGGRDGAALLLPRFAGEDVDCTASDGVSTHPPP